MNWYLYIGVGVVLVSLFVSLYVKVIGKGDKS